MVTIKKKAHTKRFSLIESMSQEHKACLLGLFAEGWNVAEIANRAQAEGYFPGMTLAAVSQYLFSYQATVLKPSTAPELSPIDVMYELTFLVHQQRERVQKALTDKTLKPSQVDGIVKTHAGLLHQYLDMSFDLGILKKVSQSPKTSHAWAEPIVDSPGRRHVMRDMRRSEQWERATQKFYAIVEEPGLIENLQAKREENPEAWEKAYQDYLAVVNVPPDEEEAQHPELENGHHTTQ